MITNKLHISPQADNSEIEIFSLKNKSMSVFEERSTYINCHRMFFAYHEKLPNIITLFGMQYEKAIKWVETELEDLIIKKHYKCRTIDKKKKYNYINVIYLLKNEMMVDIENNGAIAILFTNRSESAAMKIESSIRKFRRRKTNNGNINLLIDGQFGMDLVPIKNKKPKLDLSLNYNDDLMEVHKHLKQILNKKNQSGLVLLHGIPGTGKSTYLRYLIHGIKKKVIFLPPKIAGNLDSPSMTSFLIDNPNSVIIIEDAEELIKSREGRGDANISMLLNLTDGILGESLGIQVVCTFNTNVRNIDRALMRKGRLIASYEFHHLAAPKTIALLEKLGHKQKNKNNELTLAEIYCMNESIGEVVDSSKQIGFQVNTEMN